jgi:hypothetical protein
VLPLAAEQFPTLQKVWSDSAYEGPRVERIAQQARVEVESVKRTGPTHGLVVQAKRWGVERTLGVVEPRATSGQRLRANRGVRRSLCLHGDDSTDAAPPRLIASPQHPLLNIL